MSTRLHVRDADPHKQTMETDPTIQRGNESSNSLRGRPRIREKLILGFLFLCGFLSIFVTFGIIYELGKESLLFFGRTQWEETNRELAESISADQTTFSVSATGSTLEPGELLRIESEVIHLVAVQGNFFTVERGAAGTQAASHSSGIQAYKGVQPSLVEFFTGTVWSPHSGQFGILPLLNSTLMVSGIAILVAVPLGLASAVYLSEYASQRVRNTLKPILEILAGVPTVVYGFFALTFMTPLLRSIFGNEVVGIYNMASSGIVIGILILPLISTISEDALNAVPRSLREAAYALGATRYETALKVVVPAAFSGIAAAIILGASRAVGETMVVAIAAGAGPNLTFNPFEAAETMTGHIVRISGGDLSYDSLDYNSIFAIGLMLFIMTLVLNIISQRIVRRFREVYE